MAISGASDDRNRRRSLAAAGIAAALALMIVPAAPARAGSTADDDAAYRAWTEAKAAPASPAPIAASRADGAIIANSASLPPSAISADPSAAAEIPSLPAGSQLDNAAEPPGTSFGAPPQSQPDDNNDLLLYEQEQSGAPPGPFYGSQGFPPMMAPADTMESPIGIELRQSHRSLKSGEEADGLLIVKVKEGSPAAIAGLHGYHHGVRDGLVGVVIVGAMLAFPPALLIVPAVDYLHVGSSYDLIIGVDGVRVINFQEFIDRMHDVEPGEIVYLSIVRDGIRKQVPVAIPRGFSVAGTVP